MILLTVGSELPFDRLVAAVDEWAGARGRSDIFGQLCEDSGGSYRPRNFEWTARLSPPDFRARIAECNCIVGHAGTGTIVDALTHRKPLLIMPRRAGLRETRNDHQLSTAAKFRSRPGVRVALEASALAAELDALLLDTGTTEPLSPFAAPELIAALRGQILATSDKGAEAEC